MNETCTYLIQLRGQINEDEVNTVSPFPLMLEWGDTNATLFTTSTDQTGLIRLMRHLHKQGFVFLAMHCKK